jgi:type III restriction enzyme
VWISGLEMVQRKLGVSLVYDLSATPFFLSGSGYLEGTLFPWTMSDFSLMDAIECGIVKLPRVPIADNVPGGDTPKFRNLWEEIKKSPQGLPKKGRSAGKSYDPLKLPIILCSALEALYGHYEKTFDLWREGGIGVPPVFIIVCNNTSTSELVYKYVSGFHRENDDGSTTLENGRLASATLTTSATGWRGQTRSLLTRLSWRAPRPSTKTFGKSQPMKLIGFGETS